jgi:hypothetical protein
LVGFLKVAGMGCGEVMSNIAKYGWETVVRQRVWSSRVGEYKRGQLMSPQSVDNGLELISADAFPHITISFGSAM